MAERDIIIKEGMDYNGIFNFKDFYKYAYQWFRDEQYEPALEEKYQEKVSGNSKELLIEWKVQKRVSDYFKVEILVKIEIFGLSDVEVEIDGKRKKSNQGNMLFGVKGYIVKDPESKWDVSPMYKFIRELYDKYVIPGRVDRVEDIVKDDVRDFKEALKSFLEMQGRRY